MEDPNLIVNTIQMVQDIGFVGLLIVLAIPKLRKLIFNGENGNKEIGQLKDQLNALENNHLHEITAKLDRLIEEEIKGNEEVRTLIRMMKKR